MTYPILVHLGLFSSCEICAFGQCCVYLYICTDVFVCICLCVSGGELQTCCQEIWRRPSALQWPHGLPAGACQDREGLWWPANGLVQEMETAHWERSACGGGSIKNSSATEIWYLGSMNICIILFFLIPRSPVRLGGESLARCDDRGREGEWDAPRREEQPGERRRGASEELAEGGVPQANHRRIQRGQGGGGGIQEGSETVGQEAQGGEEEGIHIHHQLLSVIIVVPGEKRVWRDMSKNVTNVVLLSHKQGHPSSHGHYLRLVNKDGFGHLVHLMSFGARVFAVEKEEFSCSIEVPIAANHDI